MRIGWEDVGEEGGECVVWSHDCWPIGGKGEMLVRCTGVVIPDSYSFNSV